MNSIVEILSAAKEAFVTGDFKKVTTLLVPLCDTSSREIAGLAAYISGLAYTAQKEMSSASLLFQKAVDFQYNDPALYEGYGASLQQRARYDDAEKIYQKGIEICGRVPSLLSHWSTIELIRGNTSHAEDLLKEALRTNDQDHMGWTNLGNLFQIRAQYRDAVNCYKEALKLSPHYDSAISNLLLTSNYTRLPREEVFQAHTFYALAITPTSEPRKLQNRKKSGKIRIGYLTGDFRTHSVAYFFAPILQNHNRDEFEIICYSDLYSPDPVTKRFEKQADQWRDISRMNNSEVIACIQDDSLDILVDLAGHCGNRRLAVFRSKPAPIQVNWIGYPNTTGLPEMDYRIVDAITDPVGDSERFHTEKLLRLPDSFLCFVPSQDIPPVSELPAKSNGYITFGSCNNLAKISDETVEIWCDLLKAIPHSRLKLKSKPLKDPLTRELFKQKFIASGIAEERLSFEGHRSSNRDHLTFYHDIDIALDTFPYNGTTTTCESLSMGVPVMTLLGDRHASRVSASILNAVGYNVLTAKNRDEFITLGKALSSDIENLEIIRSKLRIDLQKSSMFDGKKLCHHLESLYKEIVR